MASWPQALDYLADVSAIGVSLLAIHLPKGPHTRHRRLPQSHQLRRLRCIFKTLHLFQVLHVEEYRRMMGAQLNIGESRHNLARPVFFGNLGRLQRGFERGMEDQLGALGLGLNAIAWWNSPYIDAAAKKLEAGGLGISPEIRARLSPLLFEHINFDGFYPFHRPDLGGGICALRDPAAAEHEEE